MSMCLSMCLFFLCIQDDLRGGDDGGREYFLVDVCRGKAVGARA
jgi:hypothetical protein